ncbi:flagellar protein FlaG [Sporosarcina limicola]|uniref:Flagellar protein FlaG n=1 Tax=Sporosarcina limicola TaxID=34101 RepID=A0A927MII3_9BACL|nr:flagellar protein FlaG [Sporosarcina limicola]MBE1555025.1 flagellar protein FlaG [Sporosarcina limicola]
MVNGVSSSLATRQLGILTDKAIEIKQPAFEKKVHLSADEAMQMTDGMNKFLAGSNTQLRFEFHEKLKEYYVTIIDPITQKVVKEIPSRKLLDFHAAMRDFAGVFVDRKI